MFKLIILAVLVACLQAANIRKLKAPPHAKPKSYPRHIRDTIRVNNGGQWGNWGQAEFCPDETYATGFDIKLEPYKGVFIDDTSANAIKLRCSHKDTGKFIGTATSQEGPWGDWKGSKNCMRGEDGLQFYLSGFRLKVEEPRGASDDTTVNGIIFVCRPMNKATAYNIESPAEQWGRYGSTSELCPAGSAICGLQTKVEPPRGVFVDDTSLNDVTFFCCN